MSLTSFQLHQRLRRIGSSSIAAVLGLSPWSTPYEEWLRITGRSEFDGNDATNVGNELEQSIANLSARKLGFSDPAKYQNSIEWEEWAIATPDFIATDGNANIVLLETKNVGGNVWLSRAWDEHSSSGYPDYVYAQVQFQLHISSVSLGAVGALVAGMGPWVYRMEYDEEFCNGMFRLGRDWWETHVASDLPPPVDHSDGARKHLLERYPKIRRPKLLPPTHEADDAARELRYARKTISEMRKNESTAKNRLSEIIGDAAGIMTSEGPIKWGSRKTATGTTRSITTPRWRHHE